MIWRWFRTFLCKIGEHEEYIHRYEGGAFNKRCHHCSAVIPC